MTRSTALAAGTAALAAVVVGGGVAYAVVGDDDPAITGDALQQASDAALDHTGEGTVTDSEVGDEEGYYEVEVTLDDGQEVDVHLDEDFVVLGTEGGDDVDDDAQVTGPARDQAAAAALEAAGGGTVTDVEVADDGADGYEVEVQQEDGTEVEVDLGTDFAVLSVENDDD